MASTNKTSNYELSQFLGTDKPTFLGDYNGDMLKIDTAVKGVDTKAETAQSTANTAVASASGAVDAASQAQTDATTAVSTASTAASTANTAADTANNAQSTAVLAKSTADAVAASVGDITELETTDKTSVVNAVNEIVDKLTPDIVTITAESGETNSQMLARVRAAIDFNKITPNTVLRKGNYYIFHLRMATASAAEFTDTRCVNTGLLVEGIDLASTPKYYRTVVTTSAVTITDLSENTASGTIEIIY